MSAFKNGIVITALSVFALACQPAKPTTAVTAVTPIPVGDSRCPSGGIDVKTGATDQVICSVGTTVTAIPAGDARCAQGGIDVKTGTTDQVICNVTTTVTAIPVGDARCAQGGIDVKTGAGDQVICNAGTTVTSIPAGDARCPAGGIEVKLGTQDQIICNTPGQLAVATALALGDANCPSGGEEIQIGLDNGANGGIGGDGTLESGEIVSTHYVCNTDGTNFGSTTPPPGAPGTNAINTSGGAATTGAGGDGGYLETGLPFGSNGGNVELFTTGAADAGFAVPSPLPPNLGSNPLNATADLTVKWVSVASNATLNAGDYFTLGTVTDPMTGQPLFQWSGTQPVEVTGVNIAQGVTVTFDVFSNTEAYVIVRGPIVNAGTLTTQTLTDGVSKGSLVLAVYDYRGTSTSHVDLAGLTPASTGVGGTGGTFIITWYRNNVGGILNEGTIDVSGGDGNLGNGGAAGAVQLDATYTIMNTGAIIARGGAGLGATGVGGTGGVAVLGDNYGDVDNSGDIDTSGGTGTQVGGAGGGAILTVQDSGNLVNSGRLIAIGGDVAAACASGCVGGAGGLLAVSSVGGDVVNSGDLITHGGTGAAGAGGSGGYVALYTDPSTLTGGNPVVASGSITLSGNLDTHGGNGTTTGGSGGFVSILARGPMGDAGGQEIRLLGYGAGVNLNGGAGGTIGGTAGYLQAFTTAGTNMNGTVTPGGSVINNCAITARGGAATNGAGGAGGHFDLETQSFYEFVDPVEFIVNGGDVDLSGGAGTTKGGVGGYFFMSSRNGVTNTGALTGNGGGASGIGGVGGSVASGSRNGLFSDAGPVVNSGTISLNGGNATATGGVGGSAITQTNTFNLQGLPTSNAGDISLNGGDGVTSGGNAGNVFILSITGTTTDTGTVSNSPGAGATPGLDGTVVIDGHLVTG